jgi:hypothetical protein
MTYKTDVRTVYKQILINAKLQIGKRGKITALPGRSPLKSKGLHWTVVPSKKDKRSQL